MKVDESGAPWPYDPVETAEDDAGVPTWKCPGARCDCHPAKGDTERTAHRVLFFDGGANRMGGARCRLLEDGELINKKAPYADGSGAVSVLVRPTTRVLDLEWAPADLPTGSHYPYRKRYYLNLGEGQDEGVQRRLHNLGFSAHGAVDENIRDFQRSYRQTPTGLVDDVKAELASFHDDGTLPPLPRSSGSSADTQLAFAPGTASTIVTLAPGSTPVAGGVQPQGSATAVLMTTLRIRVRSRAGRPIAGATVEIDTGKVPVKTATTGPNGFVTISLGEDEIDFATTPPGVAVVRARKHHHGPERHDLEIVKEEDIIVQVILTPPSFDTLPELRGFLHRKMPLAIDKHGSFLDLVLRDMGMNRGVQSPNWTRRLSDEEVQNELIYYHMTEDITLAPTSDFQFDHDTATGADGLCTAKCKLKSPKANLWVHLATSTMAGVTWFNLIDPLIPAKRGPTSVTADDVFLNDTITWTRFPSLSRLDQRHLVGLVRLCQELSECHDIVAIYTQGTQGGSPANAHGYGRATDFGGASTELPAPEEAKISGPQRLRVRLGVDFIVLYHWGAWERVAMWDPATVRAKPGVPTKPLRLAPTDHNLNINYTLIPPGETAPPPLRYRLDPPPYQDPPKQGADPELAKLAPHFVTAALLFKAVHSFAAREYSNKSDVVGPLPGDTETPLEMDMDAPEGHKTIYPDYAKPNPPTNPFGGRQAHANHLHFQLGVNDNKGVLRTR